MWAMRCRPTRSKMVLATVVLPDRVPPATPIVMGVVFPDILPPLTHISGPINRPGRLTATISKVRVSASTAHRGQRCGKRVVAQLASQVTVKAEASAVEGQSVPLRIRPRTDNRPIVPDSSVNPIFRPTDVIT